MLKDGHIIIDDFPQDPSKKSLHCAHCGQIYIYKLPINMMEFAKLLKHFKKFHRKCEKRS